MQTPVEQLDAARHLAGEASKLVLAIRIVLEKADPRQCNPEVQSAVALTASVHTLLDAIEA